MKTLALQGNLLNLFVALAMGGKEGEDLRVPFDEWDCGVVYEGDYFNPQRNVADIWSAVIRLRLSTQDAGNGHWIVTLPQKMLDSEVVAFPTFCCADPLKGYCLALVWSVFGSEMPDEIESERFGQVPLAQYNVDFDEPVDYPAAVAV
ncbi:hypothetical protein [Azomonas macrocytogenes]|uniref:Uncharacterized protein n=1 Tax=Azomonas macrocytogenes TaxID=69962 RepID=A0A839T6Z5_AZOMA|nr:hypothetical protein [Azomonas macrocytogenes]MBB3105251.1 hypothetical protein [Azomonas macrocytogenes]